MSSPTMASDSSTSVSGAQTESFWADLKHTRRQELFYTKENIGRDYLKFDT